MSAIKELIDTLEDRIKELLIKFNNLEKENQELRTEITKAVQIMQQQSAELEALTKEHEALKVSSTLLGSEENTRETKDKINSLIRDIDYCITQLSD